MCGRLKTPDELNEIGPQLGLKDFLPDYKVRYNTPPTALVPVVTSEKGARKLRLMKWGLLPAWAKDDKMAYATFNARSDTVATKPAFRSAWKAGRRCLVLADGFYEWKKGPGKNDKQPYFITLGNRQPMTFAGLWEEWTDKATGQIIESCTILTTDANEAMAKVHDRMPVIIGPDDWAAWLGEAECDPATLCKPFAPERMNLWPVDKGVGNVKNQDANCCEKVAL
jgi:putative SOS response-associated peptidase YedK